MLIAMSQHVVTRGAKERKTTKSEPVQFSIVSERGQSIMIHHQQPSGSSIPVKVFAMIVPIPNGEMPRYKLPSDPHAAHLTQFSKHLYLVQ